MGARGIPPLKQKGNQGRRGYPPTLFRRKKKREGGVPPCQTKGRKRGPSPYFPANEKGRCPPLSFRRKRWGRGTGIRAVRFIIPPCSGTCSYRLVTGSQGFPITIGRFSIRTWGYQLQAATICLHCDVMFCLFVFCLSQAKKLRAAIIRGAG